MTLDYYTLQEVEPTRFGFGFHGAEPYAANATEYFDSDVKSIVVSGDAWTGEGQPAAAAVMRSNSVALEVSRIQMGAGITAVDALTTAIVKAQQDLEQVVSDLVAKTEGTGYSIYVSPDGVACLKAVSISGGSEGWRVSLEDDVQMANLTISSILNYARSADLTAQELLNRIANTRPVFSTNASNQTLAYNQAMRTIAYTNLSLANLSEQAWEHMGPEEWRPVVPEGWSWTDALVTAFGLSSWKSFVKARGEDAVWKGLEAVEDTVNKGSRKAIPVFGQYFMVLDGITGGLQDPYLANPDGPESVLGGKPTSCDAQLQDYIDEYYLEQAPGAPLTLAQAARLQSIGALEPDGHDYVAQARELREHLSGWLAGSIQDDVTEQSMDLPSGSDDPCEIPLPSGDTIEDTDRDAAADLINRLDKVLGPR